MTSSDNPSPPSKGNPLAIPADKASMTTLPLPTSATATPAIPSGASPSPLTPEQFIEYQTALVRSKKIRRATTIAATDAWLTAIFAALTLPCAIFGLDALFVGAALAVVAFNSFRGLRGLKRLDTAAPRLLALNQLLLIGVLTVYSAWSVWSVAAGHSSVAQALGSNPELSSAAGIDVQKLNWYLTLTVYGSLVIATLIAQGSAALYYASRRKHIEAYLAQTPAWIIALQKAQAGAP